MSVDLLILNDQIVGHVLRNPSIQERFPEIKKMMDYYNSATGCRCNSGKRRREAIQRVKTHILESSAVDKADFKRLINANRVRITGFQHGRPVIVTF